MSPRRGPCCRISPTCSHYGAQALQSHGLRRGLWLTARRPLRCRPGSAGGSDPVPPARG
ncbi:MAG: membrane protein insertion efficiency factor YidD [Jatrophihabitantaceae bacterium]